jgi:hypothetical protein
VCKAQPGGEELGERVFWFSDKRSVYYFDNHVPENRQPCAPVKPGLLLRSADYR